MTTKDLILATAAEAKAFLTESTRSRSASATPGHTKRRLEDLLTSAKGPTGTITIWKTLQPDVAEYEIKDTVTLRLLYAAAANLDQS